MLNGLATTAVLPWLAPDHLVLLESSTFEKGLLRAFLPSGGTVFVRGLPRRA